MSPTKKDHVNVSYVRSRGYLVQQMVHGNNDKAIVSANFGCITKMFAKKISEMYMKYKQLVIGKERLDMICEKKLESGLETFHLAISLLQHLHPETKDFDGLTKLGDKFFTNKKTATPQLKLMEELVKHLFNCYTEEDTEKRYTPDGIEISNCKRGTDSEKVLDKLEKELIEFFKNSGSGGDAENHTIDENRLNLVILSIKTLRCRKQIVRQPKHDWILLKTKQQVDRNIRTFEPFGSRKKMNEELIRTDKRLTVL